VKRRALLAGLILVPVGVRAQGKPPPKPAVKPVAKPVAKPAPRPPAPPPILQPLSGPRTELVAFDASAFPYRGMVPDSGKPFLDASAGPRRGHRTSRGDVFWEDTTYNDRRSLLYLPEGFNPRLPALIVLFLHGNGATLEHDVRDRQAVARQLADSGKNAALVAPQLAVDAADSSAGNFWRPGHFAKYIDEAAERLMRLYGDRRAGPVFNAAPVVVVAYSGGYLPAAYSLERGGAAHRVRGVILMDALYGEEPKFAAWVAARWRGAFLLSAFTESTRQENATLKHLLAARRISYSEGLPTTLTPGTVAFVATGGLEMHGEFMTRAWGPDPLRQALALIPGYPRVPPPPPKAAPKPPAKAPVKPVAKRVVKPAAKPAAAVHGKTGAVKRRVP
jgi:hypothetical protein